MSYIGHDLRKDQLHIFMEYFPLNLGSMIKTHRDNSTNFEVSEVLRYALDVAKGMNYLHKLPVIHR